MAESPQTAKDVFLAALEMTAPEQRTAFLDQACAGNRALREEVDLLLHAHAEPDSRLDRARIDLGLGVDPEMTVDQVYVEQVGARIGPYKLLKKLGEGGMGIVFLAEQKEPVERQVALKITRPGMDTQRVLARFDAERHALSMMDHPNVAKVLDAGTTDSGYPYFVMELVQGERVTAYCDEHALSVRQRLELFIPVCQALQHAHQKGIIHRDIKPSNILVAEFDGRPVPKVIDFGVAKAIDQRAAQREFSTQYGQIVGTLEYMSPEQARLSQNDVDTRSDVYSLGAVLYELLTGITPFEKRRLYGAAFDQALHIIEAEEPIKPSTRLSDSDSLPSVAALRHIEPARLTGMIRGELDWIVMKALEKDRSRRYESASSLAQDIEHYLHDEPVLASPPSAGYRMRKFARRHRVALVTTCLVAASLVLGMVGTTWQAMRAHDLADRARLGEERAEQAAEKAKTEAAIAQAVNAFLTDDLLAQSAPANEPDRDIKLRTVLDRAAANVESRFAEQPLVAAAIHMTLADTYLSLGEDDEAQRHAEKARDIRTRELGPHHRDTLSSQNTLARAFGAAGRTGDEIRLHRETLRLRRDTLGSEHKDTIGSMNNLASAYFAAERIPEAQQLLEKTLQLARDTLGSEHHTTLVAMNNLANCYLRAERIVEASQLYEEALPNMRKKLGPKHPHTLTTTGSLAWAYLGMGRIDEAIRMNEETLQLARETLGPQHHVAFTSMNNLATALEVAGRTGQVLQLREESLQLLRDKAGPAHRATRTITYVLGRTYEIQGDYDKLAGLYRDHLALAEELPAEDPDKDTTVASGGSRLGRILATCPDPDVRAPHEAVALAKKAVELVPETSGYWNTLGIAQYRAGDWHAAVEAMQKSVELSSGGDASDFFVLAMASSQIGDAAGARQWYEQGVAWTWKNSPGRDILRLGTEAAEVLGTAPPPIAVVLPLPREPLFFDRPCFDTEHLLRLLDTRRATEREEVFQQELALVGFRAPLKIVDPSWVLTRTVVLPQAVSAHYNPRDGRLYVGRREPVARSVGETGFVGGIYCIDACGHTQELLSTNRIAGVAVDYRTGDVYYSEDDVGKVRRIVFGRSQPELWVSQFPHGNTFPVGLAIAAAPAPTSAAVSVEAVVVNHGALHQRDEVYRFSTNHPDQLLALHSDAPNTGPLSGPLDVAVRADEIFVADRGVGLFRLRGEEALERLYTREQLNPTGIVVDPITGNLLVVDAWKHRLVTVDTASGAITNLVEGLICDYWGGAGIDITPDGKQLFYTEYDSGLIATFSRRSDRTSLHDRGLERAGKNDFDEAVKLFSQAIAENPDRALTYCERGFASAALNQLEQAKSDWSKALALDPAIIQHYYYRGEVCCEEGRLEEAAGEYGKALAIDPEFAPAYARRARIRLMQGQTDQAGSDLDRALELDPDDALAYAERGFALEALGEVDRAKSDWEKALQLKSNCAMQYLKRGQRSWEAGVLERAVLDYSQALRLDPHLAPALIGRGSIRLQQREFDQAMADLNRAIELEPDDALGYAERGFVFEALGEVESADSDWKKALQLKGDCAAHYLRHAEILVGGGHWDLAACLFEKALRLDPTNRHLYLRRAEAWTRCEQWSKAEQDLVKAIELGPHEAWVWSALGVIRMAAGDHDAYRRGCRELFHRYAAADPPIIPKWQLAWCCDLAPPDDEVLQQAVQFAEQATPQQGEAAFAEGVLRSVLLWAGRFEEKAECAEEDFREYANAWEGLRLAIFHAKSGRLEEARKFLEESKPLVAKAIQERQWFVYQEVAHKVMQRMAEDLIAQEERNQSRGPEQQRP